MAKKVITKQQLMEAGIRLARANPTGEITVSMLCQELGIVKSTFYRHYRSLTDLFGDALDTTQDTIRALPQILLSEKTNIEKVEDIYLASVQRIVDMGADVLAHMFAVRASSPNMGEYFFCQSSVDVLVTLIQRAQEQGEISNQAPPAEIVKAISLASIGNNLRWSFCGAELDYRAELLSMIRTILGTASNKK